MPFRSAIDSYYAYVVSKMQASVAKVFIDGASIDQPLGGYVDARDWPMTAPLEGGLYLLILSATPTEERSLAQAEYRYVCQWVWFVQGTDVSTGEVAQNRGDRFAANMQIMENLMQSNYPYFCNKNEDRKSVV